MRKKLFAVILVLCSLTMLLSNVHASGVYDLSPNTVELRWTGNEQSELKSLASTFLKLMSKPKTDYIAEHYYWIYNIDDAGNKPSKAEQTKLKKEFSDYLAKDKFFWQKAIYVEARKFSVINFDKSVSSRVCYVIHFKTTDIPSISYPGGKTLAPICMGIEREKGKFYITSYNDWTTYQINHSVREVPLQPSINYQD